MKIALIEPMPLLNKGITLYLQRQNKVSLVKSFENFEQFVLFYADVDNCFFDLYIINISSMNQDNIERIISLVSVFFTKNDKVVLIVDRQTNIDVNSIDSIVTFLNLSGDIKVLGDYIGMISEKC